MISSYEAMLASVVFALVLATLLLVKTFVSRHLTRLSSDAQLQFLSYPAEIARATRFLFLLGVALLAAFSQLTLSGRQETWLHHAWVIVLILQLALWANRLVAVSVARGFERHRDANPSGATHLMMVGLIARLTLWALAVLWALDNLGVNITTLMASLGIGGIAVALAVQNILGDIFSSVSIALDKPFVIGDFIVVDDYMGTVEYVGLKTTRIRSLGGEQIIFSNSELLKTRIRNFKQMRERRAQFAFGLSYETPADDVARIPHMLKEIITSIPFAIRFERAHFKSYGESALQFEVAYYVLDPDYNKYMDIQQDINLALMRQLRERGIAFAHPARSLYLPLNADRALSGMMGSQQQKPAERPAH